MPKPTGTELLIGHLEKTITKIKRGVQHTEEERELASRRFERLSKVDIAEHNRLLGDYVAVIRKYQPAMISAIK